MFLSSLNCSVTDECSIVEANSFNFNFIYFGLIALFSFAGLVLNLISVFILTIAIDTKNNFFQLLNHFTLNSLAINILELTSSIIYISIPQYVYEIPNLENHNLDLYCDNYEAVFYMIYIYFSMRQVLFLFAGVFDIIIVYERVQLYNPKWKTFLAAKPAIQLSFYVMLFCLFINFSGFFARRIDTKTIFIIDNNRTVLVHAYRNSEYSYKKIYNWFLFASNFIKDIFTLIFEIFINILLILALKVYRKQKTRLQRTVLKKRSIFTKEDLGMVKTALLLSFFSAILHLFNFGTFLAKQFDTTPNQIYYILIGILGSLLILIRHSINFFIFLNFNKRFQTEFYKIFGLQK